MRSARCLAATAVILLTAGVGGWLAPLVHAESSPPVVETGWWSRDVLAQPVADGGFSIGWALEQEQSSAALRMDLSAALTGTVFLELHEIGGAAGDLGLAQVCVTEDDWEAANPGPYADRPDASCTAGTTADLGRDAIALTWLADITALVEAAEGDSLSLVVRPVGKPIADGLPATAPFRVDFDRAGLLVDSAGPAAPGDPDAPPAGPGVDLGEGSFMDPGLPIPDSGFAFDAPPLPEVTGPAPGSAPSTTVGATPGDLVALGPVDVVPSEGKPWVRVVLLVPISAGIGAAMAAGRRWRLERAVAHGLA